MIPMLHYSMNKPYKQVLLLLNFYLPRLHRGIVDYARAHQWHLEVSTPYFLKESARNWKGDAVITDMKEYLPQFRKHGIRIAVPAETLMEYADCTVCPDDRRIGTIAAEYFLYKGFTQFALCTGTTRGKAFRERIERSGYPVITIQSSYPHSKATALRQRTAHLAALPRPCAVFCENDWDSARTVNQALDAGIRIPEELSVLGVGNDDLLCNSTSIPLSSVETRLYERGLRLAEALDRILDGAAPGTVQYLEPSSNVIERESTGFYAVEHPVLREMIQWLTARAAMPVQISELAEQFHLSVSAVYRIFMSHLGISPKKLLLNTRIDIARRLLLNTDDKISTIAEDAGFPTAASFFETFHKLHSCTPQAWRKGNR